VSDLPCDKHGERARGKLLSFYMTCIRSGERMERRLRLCQDCIDDMASTYRGQWSDGFLLQRSNENWACCSCGEVSMEKGSRHPLYVTCWNVRQQRFDYSALYCDGCADLLIGSFGLERKAARAS
jgi:hypothetical protein